MIRSSSEFIDGWWSQSARRPSPNYNTRPARTVIDMLVVHAISLPPGEYGSGDVEALFCNTLECDKHPYYAHLQALKVSAHFFIDRAGRTTQYVSVSDRAWHAGASRFGGRENCNDRSVGVELEGCDTDLFTPAQYRALNDVSRMLMDEFPAISLARVVGHSDIAPVRKTDPGRGFDWIRYRAALAVRIRA